MTSDRRDRPSRPSRPGRPGYDQETVVRRAVEIFNERGYEATSIGDLATALGLTKSAIYHHVTSKEHLLELSLEQALAPLSTALESVEARVDLRPALQLREAVRASVVVLLRHLPAVTLLLRVRGNTEVEQAALARRREIDARLARLVEQAVAAGELRDDLPADLTSRLLFGMVNSLVEWVQPGSDDSNEQLAEAVVTLAFEGLAWSSLSAEAKRRSRR